MSRFVDVVLASGQAPAFTYAQSDPPVSPGDLVKVPFGRTSLWAIALSCHDKEPTFPVKQIMDKPLDRPFVPAHLAELVRWIADYYLCPPGVAAGPLWSAAGPSTLVRLGLGARKRKASPPGWNLESLVSPRESIELSPNPDQSAAADAIVQAMTAGGFAPMLLAGVTGSGKTATYLLAAREAIRRGKDVLILVPEIGLTPQTVRRTADFLGQNVAVLHSQLSDLDRARAWTSLREGSARVALGPRSALFAPLFDPGLIVVDEEHDGSYKQSGDAPRYHGRDAAVWLAHRLGIPVVLGSATPSLESWHNATTSRYRLLDLPHRATGAPMPKVRTVDLGAERKRTGGAISSVLRVDLERTLAAGKSAVVLHNRRGWSPQAICLDCQTALECPNCPGLRLTWHKDRSRLACHHCGHESPPPRACPACGSEELEAKGYAIQRVEDELRRLFPDTPLARLDRDSAAKAAVLEKIIDDFREHGGILLGTQMVAKGHDIPSVTLVGVTDADIGSQTPDFRASERTFQLLSQVAGRSGRASDPGEVLLQTRSPGNPLFAEVAAHDFGAFALRELETRQILRLPPFSRLILVEASGSDYALVEAWMDRLAKTLRPALETLGHFLAGPMEAPIPVVAGRHRVHLLAKARADASGTLRRAVREAMASCNIPSGIRAFADVDPVDLL
ncbi:MAG: primosomal protein N' [Fibrobacteres bacterium]|nr:primosomal protein N' [Fibrobacterota bacterium]